MQIKKISTTNKFESKWLQSLLFMCGWRWYDMSTDIIEIPNNQLIFVLDYTNFSFRVAYDIESQLEDGKITFFGNHEKIKSELDINTQGENIFI